MAKVKSVFLDFVRHVVNGDVDEVARRLATNPSLATAPAEVGATRQGASDYFFAEIAHYLYAGDTALHMAAAAFRTSVARILVAHGADCRARNRRGAEPLHYAADANHWDPTAQAETIEYLLSVGADPTPWTTAAWRPFTGRCEHGRCRRSKRCWMAAPARQRRTRRGRRPCTSPSRQRGGEEAVPSTPAGSRR